MNIKKINRLAFLFAAFLCQTIASHGQEKINADSFLQALPHVESYKHALDIHNRLARHYMYNDSTAALFHMEATDSIAEAHQDTIGRILASHMKTRYYHIRSNYPAILERQKWNLAMAKNIGREDFISGSYSGISVAYQSMGLQDSAEYYSEIAIDFAKRRAKPDSAAITGHLYNHAALFFRRADFASALNHYLDGLVYAEASGNPYSIALIQDGIGMTYRKLGDDLSARAYHREAIANYQLVENRVSEAGATHNLGTAFKHEHPDSARYYYQKSIALAKSIGHKEYTVLGQMALADVDEMEGKTNLAIAGYEKVLETYRAMDDQRGIGNVSRRLAECYVDQQKFAKALPLLQTAIKVLHEREDLEGETKALRLKSEAMEGLGRHREALAAFRAHQVLHDSLENKRYGNEVRTIQTQFETQKKEVEIARQEVVIEEQKREKQKLLGGGLTLALLLGSIIWGLQFRSRKNRMIAMQRDEIQSQKIQQLERDRKFLSMSSMLEGQEAERIRIAKDLHDGLGGLLFTVKARMTNIMSEVRKIESFSVYEKTSELVDEACQEVRRISHNLMPGALRLLGLQGALEDLVEEINETYSLQTRLEVINFEDAELNDTQQVFLFRIVQEAVNNSIKYAEAQDILVQLSGSDEHYHLTIEDDGKGFDLAQKSGGLGLQSIESRVNHLQGSIDIDSRIGIGTTLSITVPKNHENPSSQISMKS